MSSILGALAFLAVGAGCLFAFMMYLTSIRSMAAHELDCFPVFVTIVEQPAYMFTATGCEKTVRIECHGGSCYPTGDAAPVDCCGEKRGWREAD